MDAVAPDPLRRSRDAPPARTLVEILAATAATHPDEPAIDDGREVLSYHDLLAAVGELAERLGRSGLGRGDRVAVRLSSGTNDLYVAILAVLHIGAAYVPIDADDPDERAGLISREAGVAAVVTDGPAIELTDRADSARVARPELDDDAWIIFTSGSTGLPKGVAVTHRSAAAFVDAEAHIFLADDEDGLGPGDRVLAGLSVGFDASCEEMWLAWRAGACLVPAPRSLVRSGMDLGPWLVSQGITVVSTVPTLAGLWPADALDQVRLLIFGGEACPPALVERVVVPGREVWNTYGPTEATVVACAARLGRDGPVRIGLPLAGWDLAVVDDQGHPVPVGGTGELIIGGVGLARYLDPAKDAERFAPAAALGWERAYRSGDLVVHDPDGLLFVGRADDQVKLGARRIELGEVDAALLALPGVRAAAATVQTTPAGHHVLVGYVVGEDIDLRAATAELRERLPAALVPLLTECPEIPTRVSGKVDRTRLPWPLPGRDDRSDEVVHGMAGWLADCWRDVLGTAPGSLDDDFFELGGGSLAAAQLVSGLRGEYPQATVADVYAFPRLAAMAVRMEELRAIGQPADRAWVRRTPRPTQGLQLGLTLLLQTVVGLRWLVWLLTLTGLLARTGDHPWAPTASWWWVGAGWVVLVSPAGRMGLAAAGARLLLRGVQPGTYPRGGSVHARLWAAEQLADAAGAATLAGAPWISYYARALGATVGQGVDLHALPPVTGFLTLGDGASVEPEVDLAGYWIDGDDLRLGHITIGAGAAVGSRSTLLPGCRIGPGAEVLPGSAVDGRVPARERWSGSPARRVSKAKPPWPDARPPRNRRWVAAFAVASGVMSLLPLVAGAAAALVLGWAVDGAVDGGEATVRALAVVPLATVVGFATLTLLTLGGVRLLGLGLREGTFPVRSRMGWQVWATERLLDAARTMLFPLYASLLTPVWLRALGAKVGAGVEASTVLLVPKMTVVGDHAFLADDTMIASYELGGGWMRVASAKVGKRAFLGNSGMAAGGRSVPKNGLVAVLSAAPKKAKAGTSWLGSPPVRLRRTAQVTDERRTFAPPVRLRVARGAVELCRIVPVMVSVAIAVGVLGALAALADRYGLVASAALSGAVMLAAGFVAAATTTAAKWLVVGRLRPDEHPLWSGFVWRNEVVDTFVEMVAAPWFANGAAGTPALSMWLRSLGARVGRGVWCESYWLPEADLVRLGDGATVNRGCVLQTHLFHDRVMSTGTVDLDHGATLGPHSVILPAAAIGADATVGPASLVMRGEHVPARTRWTGNPIAPWDESDGRRG
ncbi:MAG TPA: Pls/PosA family non-ribosomal peptide synthetase [Acidimicrobiales bacterium]|nr:Pls/PosA family non-ribosomal peptide synthetase [Acidimicrobiales bacterium]